MGKDNRYSVLTIATSDAVVNDTKKVYEKSGIDSKYAANMYETLDALMDTKVDAIVMHTEIEEEEIIQLLGIINHDYENQKTPIIIISSLKCSENIATSTSKSNVIAIFSHTNWQYQLSNLLSLLQSQTFHTLSLKNKLVESEGRNIIDPLTGAFNRYGAEDTFQHLTSRFKAYGELFSLIMLDIDHFKKVNDTYGHDVGDEVLISFSSIITSLIRDRDAFIRFGGEEFVVFIANATLETATTKAETMCKKIEEASHSHKKLKITSSFGVVEYRENEDLESMVKRSDDLLYYAKDNGRNMVVSERVPL